MKTSLEIQQNHWDFILDREDNVQPLVSSVVSENEYMGEWKFALLKGKFAS